MNHVIVLAAGDLLPSDLGVTLLDRTLARARRLVDDEGIVVVTTAAHRAEADACMARWPRVSRVEQPQDLGTLPALALAVLFILERDPHARLVVLPSGHTVNDDLGFADCLARALTNVDFYPFDLLLLGAELDGPEEGHDWILPVKGRPGLPRLEACQDAPTAEERRELVGLGAVANTSVMVGDGWTFAELVLRLAPQWFHAIRQALAHPETPWVLAEVYARLPAADFSHNVLEKAPGSLRLAPMPRVGWSRELECRGAKLKTWMSTLDRRDSRPGAR